jgi:hypothetical protein
MEGVFLMKRVLRTLTRFYRAYIPNVAILFLFPVSCWSTFSGVRELMRSTEALSDLEGLFVSVGLTVGIQITLLFAVNSITRSRASKRPLYLGIYVLTVFFSVLFGYAFYFRHLRADDFARQVHEGESQRLLLDSEGYRARFGSVARSLNELADFSSSQSELEDQIGKTCGDNSPSGKGPRSRGRRQDADIFRQYDHEMNQLSVALDTELENLRGDLSEYSTETLGRHHDVLNVFYQRMVGQKQQADELLSEIKIYVRLRFPGGRYTIKEGNAVFECPDSRMEHLATVIADQQFPNLPPPPLKFRSDDPKAVVQYAMDQMTGWVAAVPAFFSGGDSGPPDGSAGAVSAALTSRSVSDFTRSDARDNLPLYLGLLVDCLIFLAAFSTNRGRSMEVNSLERLRSLEELSVPVRDRLRGQLARLLGCSPTVSTFVAYRLLSRFEVRPKLGADNRYRPVSYVAVPRTGQFLDRYPEVQNLRDLIRLLEALELSTCKDPDLRWMTLESPLPAGLGEIRLAENDRLVNEALELHRLDERLMGDLMKEAFLAEDFPVVVDESPVAAVEPGEDGAIPAGAS